MGKGKVCRYIVDRIEVIVQPLLQGEGLNYYNQGSCTFLKVWERSSDILYFLIPSFDARNSSMSLSNPMNLPDQSFYFRGMHNSINLKCRT